ncbi:MAG TPA: GNAT family N-acetyltransferase [Solimonas sp.]|nr:GNAT family N-acetyltransferase [Solimonas sp.]
MTDLQWRWYAWEQLDPDTLYGFLRLRSEIFVVEQNCVFPDMDGVDPRCTHLCGRDAQGRLLAYLRLLPPGVERAVHTVEGERAPSAPGPALGRLVVHADARGKGLARAAMLEGLRICAFRYGGQPVSLSAQRHLSHFYASLGFREASEPYLEDGIWHVDMRRDAAA